jgi:hypothetical protein
MGFSLRFKMSLAISNKINRHRNIKKSGVVVIEIGNILFMGVHGVVPFGFFCPLFRIFPSILLWVKQNSPPHGKIALYDHGFIIDVTRCNFSHVKWSTFYPHWKLRFRAKLCFTVNKLPLVQIFFFVSNFFPIYSIWQCLCFNLTLYT